MCMFTQPVERVSKTEIFARLIAEDGVPKQVLVYSMEFTAAEDLAMVLALPTPLASPEDAVRFVSLEEYADFFKDMRKGFPEAKSRGPAAAPAGLTDSKPILNVHDVGAFEASFVPKPEDFSRLDARFRLPDDIWKKLPGGQDYGFAVFKLKGGPGSQRVHPMALVFPTRNMHQIFFPTVHLHRGDFEKRAEFDHRLYFQGSDALRLPLVFDRKTGRFGRFAGSLLGVGGGTSVPYSSTSKASDFVECSEDRGLVDPERLIYKFELRGLLPNRDVSLWPKYHPNAGQYP